ncbi:NAD-dependent epimerase [Ekhidna sp. To15]|uniref:NAD-dependent epimerase n=1 Tax=Ekhidna sp. To15 TaxID=3395267 RepID=UPI003F51E391
MSKTSSILVTGSAGFIGFHLSKRLLEEGFQVVGIDSLNDYYDVSIKNDRTKILINKQNYTFYHIDLNQKDELSKIFKKHKFDRVINLAAQAGVRYSITNPEAYLRSNLSAFLNILEECRHNGIGHLIYASSSSVYGANTTMPFSVEQTVDHPISLYAATKKANELMAHTYASNYGLPVTGLRFFTVYGPWGRPDMALFLFTKAILENKPIDVYNNGQMRRDFTYIDDIVEGIYRLLDHIPIENSNWDSNNPDPATSFAPYHLFNIGNNNPIELLSFIEAIEKILGKKAQKNFLPIQTGDVPETYADVSKLEKAIGYKPKTSVDFGVSKFIGWYRDYYNV